MDIAGLLSHHARYVPGKLALVFEDQRFTYAELEARVNRLANAMLDAGTMQGGSCGHAAAELRRTA